MITGAAAAHRTGRWPVIMIRTMKPYGVSCPNAFMITIMITGGLHRHSTNRAYD
jgi:hypothetical protein